MIGEQHFFGMMFRQFPIHNIYVTIFEKLSELHFIVLFFLNSGKKVQKRMKTMGQMFYYFLDLLPAV